MKKIMALSLLAMGFSVGCSSTQRADTKLAETMAPEVKSAANVTDATFVTEVSFQKGSSQLTPAAKSRISELIRDARGSGEIEDIKVISWADQEYPSEEAKKLSSEQRNLADARNREIRRQIAAVDGAIDVDAYNMAERPNALSRLVGTENAKLKKSLEVAGLPTTASKNKVVSGKASKAMLLVIMDM
ncbi:MAG: hypothetical protein AB7F59_09410 [Bdellovibrionales bacterium]